MGHGACPWCTRRPNTRRAASAPPSGAAQDKHDPTGATQHEAAEAAHDPGWWPTLWKTANLALLVGLLIYFLRAPLEAYLTGRIGKVREDLVTAAQTRETAVRQLAEIDAKLQALPAELDALKKRGAEDLVAERARIEEDAQAERQRLLEQTRREIDMRLRIAKRELLELAADLAVNVAPSASALRSRQRIRSASSIAMPPSFRRAERGSGRPASDAPVRPRAATPARSSTSS